MRKDQKKSAFLLMKCLLCGRVSQRRLIAINLVFESQGREDGRRGDDSKERLDFLLLSKLFKYRNASEAFKSQNPQPYSEPL